MKLRLDEMETQQQESAATPLNETCLTCNNVLEFDWGSNEKLCMHCIQQYQKDDLILDVNDIAGNFSLLQLGSYPAMSTSLASPINSSVHSSPEVFLPKSVASDSSECPVHQSPNLYWCYTCTMPACLICTNQHHSMLSGHRTGPFNEAHSLLLSQLQLEVQAVKKIHSDNKLLTGSHREFLCLVIEACAFLENLMREELSSQYKSSSTGLEDSTQFLLNKITFELAGLSGLDEAAGMLRSLQAERTRLHTKQQQLVMQLSLNRVIGSSNQVLDLHTFRQAVQNLRYSGSSRLTTMDLVQPPTTQPDAIALLGNVCNARLYTKQLLASSLLTSQTSSSSPKNHQHHNVMSHVLSPSSPLHSPFPRYFLDLEVDGIFEGRVILETRPDLAPKMAKNFGSLCMGEKGLTYKGCQVFQCWGGESCIAGDFECNSGRGGRSIYADEPFFMPEDTKLPCVRAAIGMRRTQKKHHSQGLVGSQFRILLRDMPFFTGVFGHVIHGLELIERVSFLGDHQGFPRKLITVANCGLLS